MTAPPMTPVKNYPSALRIGARVVSYLFHPLFIPLLVGWFLIYEARLFPERNNWEKTIVFIQFFVYYTFLPLITTILSKSLGFIDSIQLRSQKDRIIPYIVCEIFYFWGWYVFRNLKFPEPVVLFGLSVFLACSLGLLLNIYMKVSMHAISVGVLCALIIYMGLRNEVNYGPYISVAVFIAGLTCTARLIDSNHTNREIYTGFFAGAFMLAVASFYV